MYAAADEGAIATLLAKLAVEKSYVAKLDDTRQVLRVNLEMAVLVTSTFGLLSSLSRDG